MMINCGTLSVQTRPPSGPAFEDRKSFVRYVFDSCRTELFGVEGNKATFRRWLR
jgi:hypothetical protein